MSSLNKKRNYSPATDEAQDSIFEYVDFALKNGSSEADLNDDPELIRRVQKLGTLLGHDMSGLDRTNKCQAEEKRVLEDASVKQIDKFQVSESPRKYLV